MTHMKYMIIQIRKIFKQNKIIEKVVTSSEVVIFFLFTTNFIDISNNNNIV